MLGSEASAAASTAPETVAKSTHLPGLDALRAFAVIAVILFHLDLGFVPGGFLGVSLFFTLSGYLITRNLLLETRHTGTVSLPNFWARRARRLFPAAWFVLAALSLTAALSPNIGHGIGFNGGDVLASLANVANWRFLDSGSSYASLFRLPSPVLHFWSLAIEEQSYIIVALLVALVAWRRRSESARLLGFVALGLAMISWALPLVFQMSVTRTYYGTDTRIGEILAGVALASWRHGTNLAIKRRGQQWVWTIGSLLILAMFIHWTTASSATLAEGLLPIVSLVSCAAIFVAVSPGSPLTRLGSTRIIAGIGRLSYVIYLVHWPVILLFRWRRVSLGSVTTFIGVAAVVGVMAWLIARFIEVPIRSRQWSHRTVLSAAALTIALIVGATTLWHPPLSAADQTLAELQRQSTTFGRDAASAGSTSSTLGSATRTTVGPTTRTTVRPSASLSTSPSSSSSPSSSLSPRSTSSTAKPTVTSTTAPGTTAPGSTAPGTTAPGTTAPGPTSTTKTNTGAITIVPGTTGASTPASNTSTSSTTSASSTTLPTQPAPLRVRALGDSIAFSLALATPVPNAAVTYVEGADDLTIGCGVTDFGTDNHATQCGDLPKKWAAAVPSVPADVTVILSCQWETIARNLPGATSSSHLGDPAFDNYLVQTYSAAIYELLGAGVPRVLWARCPYPSLTVGVGGLADDFIAGRQTARIDALNAIIERVVAGFHGQACVVPFDAWMNQHTNDPTLRPDGEHFDPQLAKQAGEQFAISTVESYNSCH